ncbi:sodium/calcium exchanger 1-like [Armigeres subalbatus]|uniref:sodium/calcium exchanger 1-like n=1 Tax=Armigeres subalbatus TaxID=124917 RepID=UPI002ED69642
METTTAGPKNQSPEVEEEQQARGPLLSMLIGAFNDPPWETTSSEETRLPFISRLRNNRPRGMGSMFGRIRERSKLRMQKLYEYFRPNFQPQNAVMDGGYPGDSGGLGMGTGGGGGLGIRGVGQAPVTIHLNDYSTKQYVNVNSGGVKNGADGGATHGGISLSANPTFGTDMAGGYLCFGISILCIGIVTAIIGDVASHFGCTLGIKDSVTAIVFVALGTSIPDTFASKVAAIQDKYADASVGNVTGSNAVNVFLGIGVAWTIAAVYHAYHGRDFNVEPGTLAFSVTLFCTEALVAIIVLMMRRSPKIGGELGGPKKAKYLTATFFFSLWVIYLLMSSLEAYGIIKGF